MASPRLVRAVAGVVTSERLFPGISAAAQLAIVPLFVRNFPLFDVIDGRVEETIAPIETTQSVFVPEPPVWVTLTTSAPVPLL